MDKHSLLMLFDYHFGMYDQVWECVMDLTTDRFNEESDYSLGVVNVMDSVTNPCTGPKILDREIENFKARRTHKSGGGTLRICLIQAMDFADLANAQSQ